MIRIKNPNSSRLPNEYQEVEYIESSGTQYINTGFIPNQDTRVTMSGMLLTHSANASLFGTRYSASARQFTMTWEDANNRFLSRFGNNDVQIPFTEGTVFYVDKNKNITIVNSVEYTNTDNEFTCSTALYLFATNNNGSLMHYGKLKLYSCKIYDNGTLVRDFVPCYRLADNVVGLYDTLNNLFYTNAGTGTFLMGTEVNREYVNIHPLVGDKELLARYIEDKLVYQKVSKRGIFVCVGESGKSYSSTDGLMWIGMSGLNTSYTYEGVAYGDGRFVCVGNKGSSYYSTDALTWTAMTGLTSKSFTNVAYGNGIFVCVGADGYSYYSTNGTSWTAITRLASDYIYGVTYGNDRFVCVGEGGLIYYSTTGKKWTKASGPYVTSLNSVTYGDGRFVCVGTQGKSYYSTDDGETWTSMSGLSTSSSYSSVTYGNGRFVCTGSAGRSYYSTNGTSWKAMSGLTAKDAYGDLSYGGVTYGNNRFVCVGINGYSFYSTDGLTWDAMSGLPNSTSFYEVAYAEI